LHGTEKSNDPNTFGNMHPPFNDWCKKNNIIIEKEKFRPIFGPKYFNKSK
jgi:hypothetical protein